MMSLKHTSILGITCALAIAGTSATSFAQTAIIEKGTPKATIYLDEKAPDSVQLAARELQSHLKLMTGVEVPVSTEIKADKSFGIYLGDTPLARQQGIKTDALPADGYRILSNKNWLIIAGKDYGGPAMTGFNNPWRYHESYNTKLKISAFGDAGTLQGVYRFLERYGVRWYMPGPLGTIVPKTQKVVVPSLNIRNAPTFEHRHVYFSFMERSDEDALWYRRVGFGTPAPIQVSHSFGQFFSKYKDTNPEFFALIDGQRDFTNLSTATGQGNFNLSNPDFIKQVVIDINQYFVDNPHQKIFPLCPDDGMKRISEDPESQAQIDLAREKDGGKFSNYVWGFINKVAKEVIKTHPDRLIGCIAYSDFMLPPTNIDKLSPNVAVVVCKTRSSLGDLEYKKVLEKSILDWKSKADALYGWEYYCDIVINPGWRGYPTFFSKNVQQDLQFLKGKMKGEFLEAESWSPDQYGTAPEKIVINYPGLQHPLLYVTGRLYWDPNTDLKKVMDEYYRLFYGPAEKPMRKFWETVESNWIKKGRLGAAPAEVYSTETITQLLDCLSDATKQSDPNSAYGKRVAMILNDFSPAAKVAERLAKFSKPTLTVPQAADARGRSAQFQMIDRSYSLASPTTNVNLTWDQQALHINLQSYEPDMKKVKALATEHDSARPPIWDDDVVEVFVGGDTANPEKVVHLIVNSNGAVLDSLIPNKIHGETMVWTSKAKIEVKKEATRWTAHLSIPWDELDIAQPKAGQQLRANFYRSSHATGTMQQFSWAPLQSGGFYSPQDFGTLTLGEEVLPPSSPTLPDAIELTNEQDYGSGAALLTNLYTPGGVANVGLFVGHANTLTRKDRAMFRFDLKPLAEVGNRIEKVELNFGIERYVSDETNQVINVQALTRPAEALNGDTLTTDATQTVGDLTVTAADAFFGATGRRTDVPLQKLDVTAAVKAALAQGASSITFRMRNPVAEEKGNVTMHAEGIIITKSPLPRLIITPKP
jgi:hypothetical protein